MDWRSLYRLKRGTSLLKTCFAPDDGTDFQVGFLLERADEGVACREIISKLVSHLSLPSRSSGM